MPITPIAVRFDLDRDRFADYSRDHDLNFSRAFLSFVDLRDNLFAKGYEVMSPADDKGAPDCVFVIGLGNPHLGTPSREDIVSDFNLSHPMAERCYSPTNGLYLGILREGGLFAEARDAVASTKAS